MPFLRHVNRCEKVTLSPEDKKKISALVKGSESAVENHQEKSIVERNGGTKAKVGAKQRISSGAAAAAAGGSAVAPVVTTESSAPVAPPPAAGSAEQVTLSSGATAVLEFDAERKKIRVTSV